MNRATRTSAAGILLLLAGCETAPLPRAIARGDSAAVAAQLDKGEDLNGRLGNAGLTPLQLAVQRGRVDIVTLLLDRGADVNVRRNGTSALSLAVIAGNAEMTRLLLARGAEAGRREILWSKGAGRSEIAGMLEEAARKPAAPPAAAPGATAVAAGPASSSAAAPGEDVPSYALAERPDDVALVVAVSRTMDGAEERFAAEDAAAVRRHLIALGWPQRSIVLLTNDGAGRAGLSRYLERWLPNNVVENSRVVFYFAGAGTVDAAGRAVLLPWDGDAAQPEATGYPLSRVYAMLDALKVRSAVAVIDAGFSGAGPRTAAAPKARIPAPKVDLGARDMGSVAALVAAKDAEPVGLEERERHGTLTYFLLKGLNGGALDANGFVTLKGLYRYARAQAGAPSRAGRTQTPQLLTGGLGEADLRLR
ncbi:MAG: ankyrin repeat domain-containing protein [Elusimicrobiota bacterium]